MIIDKYNNEINDTIKKVRSINNLKIDSINIYGSSANEEMFVEGISDIDMIIMSSEFEKLDVSGAIKDLNEMQINFKEKRPVFISDNLCDRIEFYVGHDNINLDITICNGLVPKRETLELDAWYDNFEALMGGVYLHSKQIYGKIPDYDLFLEKYYPFYDDELRKKRLDIIANRISSYNDRIDKYLKKDSPELIDHLFKVKKFFVKFLYIYNKAYYLTPEKHTYYQLTRFLNLDEEEKRTICFMDGTIKESAEKYLELSNRYINEYQHENGYQRSR